MGSSSSRQYSFLKTPVKQFLFSGLFKKQGENDKRDEAAMSKEHTPTVSTVGWNAKKTKRRRKRSHDDALQNQSLRRGNFLSQTKTQIQVFSGLRGLWIASSRCENWHSPQSSSLIVENGSSALDTYWFLASPSVVLRDVSLNAIHVFNVSELIQVFHLKDWTDDVFKRVAVFFFEHAVLISPHGKKEIFGSKSIWSNLKESSKRQHFQNDENGCPNNSAFVECDESTAQTPKSDDPYLFGIALLSNDSRHLVSMCVSPSHLFSVMRFAFRFPLNLCIQKCQSFDEVNPQGTPAVFHHVIDLVTC